MASSTTPAPVPRVTPWTVERAALVTRSPVAGAQEVGENKVIDTLRAYSLVDQLLAMAME